jgi:NAD(P)-dependent dehydrogenase (short-subunit alcohol dehydrogenase family)
MTTTTSLPAAHVAPSWGLDLADLQPQLVADSPALNSEVALVMNAGTDTGCRITRALLTAGYRVAATGRHTTQLARIVQDTNASRLLAIAADPTDRTQMNKLAGRVETHFGRHIDLVICAEDSRRGALVGTAFRPTNGVIPVFAA